MGLNIRSDETGRLAGEPARTETVTGVSCVAPSEGPEAQAASRRPCRVEAKGDRVTA